MYNVIYFWNLADNGHFYFISAVVYITSYSKNQIFIKLSELR